MSTSKYSARGVSAQKEDVHQAIRDSDQGIFPGAFCRILPDYAGGDPAYCNILHADTAGTKSVLAYLYWKETGDLSVWKGIVQDALVMNTDDMVCCGAIGKIVVSSTIGRNKLLIPGEVVKHLIQAVNELAGKWASWGMEIYPAGGETADIGDVIRTVDVGFTAFTRMLREKVLQIQIRPGDVIVGLASSGQTSYEEEYNSGIGCNGLTSARHDVLSHVYAEYYPESYDPHISPSLVYCGSRKLTDIDPDTGISVGKLLLSPTRTYFPVIKKIFENKIPLHGIIHCTGGGQTKVMKFANNVRIIKDNLFPLPPVFRLIRKESSVALKEMFEVFNMGHRMEIYCDPAAAPALMEIASSFNMDARIIGRVESAEGKELIIHSAGEQLRYCF